MTEWACLITTKVNTIPPKHKLKSSSLVCLMNQPNGARVSSNVYFAKGLGYDRVRVLWVKIFGRG